MVWIDDDVLVEPQWLEAYVHAAREWPEAAYFGGVVSPWFATAPPRWLQAEFPTIRHLYAIRELGDQVRPFSPGETPYGANMAFRMPVARAFPFDEALGHVGGEPRGGDDTDIFHRLQCAGLNGVWVGTARLAHYIPRERLTAAYVWDWHRWRSRMSADDVPPNGPTIKGAPRWLWRRYIEERLQAWAWSLISNRRWLEHFRRAAWLLGTIERCQAASIPGAVPVPKASSVK
jgi:hypothetical protein